MPLHRNAAAQLAFAFGPPTADQLRELIEPYDGRCPLCVAPLRAVGAPARYVGCRHALALTELGSVTNHLGRIPRPSADAATSANPTEPGGSII